MFDHATLLAAFAVLFAVHLAVAWLARRRAAPAVDERPDRLGDGRLRCPECGTANDPDSQFCRECVAKLRNRAPTAPVQPTSGGSLFR